MGDSKITEFTMYMQGKEKNPVLISVTGNIKLN